MTAHHAGTKRSNEALPFFVEAVRRGHEEQWKNKFESLAGTSREIL